MGRLRRTEYEIVPRESFSVIRDCPGCNARTHFINTGKFRINGNGKKLDVWLIYQCEKCRHTLNLAIWERVKVSSIPQQEYSRFLNNDEQLAEYYGRSIRLFQKNRAEIDPGRLDCDFVKCDDTTQETDCPDQTVIIIHNPCELKIRPEKQLARVLGESVSRVRKMILEGGLVQVNASSRCIEFTSARIPELISRSL